MSTNCNDSHGKGQIDASCPVSSKQQKPLSDTPVELFEDFRRPIIKVPTVLAETTLQIVTEATIPLNNATEIKRVLKNVFLTQCKLVPVAFRDIEGAPGFRLVTRAKLFVEGFVRKNIEYSTFSRNCTGQINFTNADVPFSGFADLCGDVEQGGDFIIFPIWANSNESRSVFLNDKKGDNPRTDKFFFENNVLFNEQPFCELVAADFFELDFSPVQVGPNQAFNSIREKMVLDLTLKVLQVQQYRINTANLVLPVLPTQACPDNISG
jgi:hypothetical protein